MSKYDYGMELPKGGSIRWGFDSIPDTSRVLELGCANGLLTRHLKLDKNCVVDIVEIDQEAGKTAVEFANTAILGMEEGNLEGHVWFERLRENRYDVITFLDVLEHLRNPEEVLRKASELLTENGSICITVPNIGHNSVLINLINNKFEYQELGIMDNTHVRFFCQDTLEKMIQESGLVAVEKSYARAPVGQAMIENSYEDVDRGISDVLKLRDKGEVFQFFYKLKRKQEETIQEIELEYKQFISRLYYNQGEGYKSNDYLECNYAIKNGEFSVFFDMSHLTDIVGYRWDPCKVSGVAVSIESIKIATRENGVGISLKAQNQDLSTEESDIFLTEQLCYITEGDVTQIQSMEIKATIKVVDYREAALLQEDKVKQLEKKEGCIQEKIQIIQEKEHVIRDKESEIQEKTQIILERNRDIDQCNRQIHALNIQLMEAYGKLGETEVQYQLILNSKAWKVTKPLRAIMDIFKRFTHKHMILRLCINGSREVRSQGFKATKKKSNYLIVNKELEHRVSLVRGLCTDEKRAQQQTNINPQNIKFGIVVLMQDENVESFIEMVESVRNQTYDNWELCVVFDKDFCERKVYKECVRYSKVDKRIKCKVAKGNGSERANAGKNVLSGNYLGVLEEGSLLHPSILYLYAHEIAEKSADLLYCDEASCNRNPIDIVDRYYKPDFAIDNIRANNYIRHFLVCSTELLERVGGFDNQVDSSYEYDLTLRLVEKAECIRHLQEILYYSHISKNPYVKDGLEVVNQKNKDKEVLRAHLERCDLKAEILDTEVPLCHRMKYQIDGEPLVSIMIPNKDSLEILKQCIDSIVEKSTYSNYEIVVVENNSVNESIFHYYREIEKNPRIRVITWEHEFNYSKINNYGVLHCKGEYIVLLNNDIEVITPTWIEEMLMYVQRDDVGAAGAMLYYPNDTIQHAGVIIGLGNAAGHSHKHYTRGDYGYMCRLLYAQNLSAVTAACLMVKRSVYEEVEGLEEKYAVAYNDVDFCMKIRTAGYLICWTPYAELYHHESISRGHEDTLEKQARFDGEITRLRETWKGEIQQGDPYYNKNLTIEYEDFSFR